nr:protein ZINC INDUCED FACILITATOR 1-like [Hydra vulgaris]
MNVKLVLRRMIYSDGMNPLKHSVIFVITFFFFINTMTTTSLFSYLPKLVKSFGASEVQAGEDAGLIGSSLFFSRIFSSLLWGYFADKYGNKKLLFLSSICIAISTLAFAFSRSFTWAFVTKLLQGAAMGVVIITKSIVVDVCDDTNVSLAFSILFTGYHLGEVIGPSLSAILVFPAEQYPNAFSKGLLF